jgi:hypothetical protein
MWKRVAVAGCAGLLAGSFLWWEGHNDRVQFHSYIQDYAPREERAWLDDHHDIVLAEGRAFCDWLEQFPEVPEVVPSGEADVGKFRMRYISATAATTDMAVSERARVTVLAGAGAHFCNGTVDSRTSFSVPEEDL